MIPVELWANGVTGCLFKHTGFMPAQLGTSIKPFRPFKRPAVSGLPQQLRVTQHELPDKKKEW